ncbi:MAG: formylglycine-generating enzyme family protein, partial [Pseudomonadota bacterium]
APPGTGGAAPTPLRRRVMAGRAVTIPLAELPPAPFVIRTDLAALEIQRLTRSDLAPWASAVGRDRHGLWAAFTFRDIRQRLRWCPPGLFRMGSPETEDGRSRAEGPQADVLIEDGFWMFDTPVTQDLYEAATGANPSRFKSPTRPVETVSFHDACKFIDTLNGDTPGLELRLPSEAEWEYACRAGSTGATYAGDMKIEGKNNAPVLNEIAWYGGNSGVDFELDDGEDSSAWLEKRFDHKKAGTMPVKLKLANAWGLYDMLGNVYEWCEDTWTGDYRVPRSQSAFAEGDAEADRVVRGGSWSGLAGRCRSAVRNGFAPGVRIGAVGFRPARGQAMGAQDIRQADAERQAREAGKAGVAEPPAAQADKPGLTSRIMSRLGLRKTED